MSVFLELTTDAFEEAFKKQAGPGGKSGTGEAIASRAGKSSARRPLRGLEIKDDTYAYIKLMRNDNTSIALYDAGSQGGRTQDGYSNFILQSVQEPRMEKSQIIETFGDGYVYFFGESPRFLDISAMLINSLDFNWEAEWWANYDQYLRGTRSVEQGARTYLFYDDNVVEGYILNAQAVKSSDSPMAIPLQFKFYVTNHRNISLIGVDDYPIRKSAQAAAQRVGVTLTSADAASKLFDIYSKSAATSKRDIEAYKIGQDVKKAYQQGFGAVSAAQKLIPVITHGLSVAPQVVAQLSALEQTDPLTAEQLRGLITREGRPLRSKIWNNTDEYVGTRIQRNPFVDDNGGVLPAGARQQALTIQESFELFRDALQFLTCFGLEISRPKVMLKIGLLPGKNAKEIASWRPAKGLPFGVALDANSQQLAQQAKDAARDPLGSLFQSAKEKVRVDTSFTQQDQTARGYRSNFAPGAGYGQAGYGFSGGDLFGTGNTGGDPGYIAPDAFRRSAIVDKRSAFQRFVDRLPPGTAVDKDGKPVGAAGTGTGVTGGFSIGGKPSPFTLSSVPGVLDPAGSGRIVDLRNPYGIKCPNPPGTYSWPQTDGLGNTGQPTSYGNGFSYPPRT